MMKPIKCQKALKLKSQARRLLRKTAKSGLFALAARSGLLLAGGLAVGAIAWQFSKYWLIDKRYEMMADKAVQAIKATGEAAKKLDEAGYGPRTISQITSD
jgi:hypothetical protein